ncbi:MAG: hypothetical protein K2L89_08900 [Muribaculaceae bacterium]|nr:hypothetical protein [Muribaculaceae bacterium]
MNLSIKNLLLAALSITFISTMPLCIYASSPRCYADSNATASTDSSRDIYTGKISDMGRAVEYCDRAPLEKIEGIWEFPEDNTRVLIRRSNQKKKVYDLIIISSPDCRLKTGETIGEITPSVEDDKLRLSLYTSRRDNILTDPSNCLALFNDKEGTIRVEKRKFKISLRFTRYLPKFWRMLSLFSSDNPTDKLPKGLVRIYPTRSGNISDPRQPIHL